MIEPSVVTQPLGGSALSRDARAGTLPRWYPAVPKGAKAWKGYARRVAESVPARWLDELEPAIAPRGLAAARLLRSAGGRGLVVTTGQQAGLFGGPLMTLIKALSARALADVLEETIGMPVAPLFWAATDDADFDEAATVSTVLGGGAREMRLEQRPPAGTPMAFAPIGAEIDDLASMLREACGSAPHRSWLECAVETFRAGNTVGDAYVALMRAVLEPVGVAVLDVSHESFTKAAAKGLHRMAQQSHVIAASLGRRTAEISAAGYDPQVEEVPGLSLVSVQENRIKRRLPFAEAVAMAPDSGTVLSSTVLVRPVLERVLVPTLGYLGGPGEVAYFAQVSAVAEALGVDTPLVLPRWSATIVEPHVRRVLDDLGIGPGELTDPHAVEGRLARALLAPDADRALRELRGDLETGVDRLAAVNGGLVPPAVLDGLRRSLEHRLERLERRFMAGVKRRETEMMAKIAKARGSLHPHGVRQERKLTFIPFLARYGPALIDEMIAAARLHAQTLVSGAPAVSPKPSTPPARV